jgi:hypothetical protein
MISKNFTTVVFKSKTLCLKQGQTPEERMLIRDFSNAEDHSIDLKRAESLRGLSYKSFVASQDCNSEDFNEERKTPPKMNKREVSSMNVR